MRTTPWRALAVFVLVSFGLTWLTILPLWLTETDGPTFTALAAVLLSGIVWGLWHTPMTLLGHNFDQPNLLGVTLMTVGSMTWGVLFGWLRLRSGSVWPAVLAHSALNSSGVLVLMLATAGVPLNMALVNPFGLSGWIVAGVTVSALALTGQFRHEPQLRPERLAATTDSPAREPLNCGAR